MSTWTKVSSSADAVFSTSAFFSKTSGSLRNPRQDNFNDDDLRNAMAIFPEFFCSCDVCHKNVHHERVITEAATENIPSDIKGWYKCEFGMK